MKHTDDIYNALSGALENHHHNHIENISFDEDFETYEVKVSGIEAGYELDALEDAENALKAIGMRIIAGEPDRRIGRFWIIAEF